MRNAFNFVTATAACRPVAMAGTARTQTAPGSFGATNGGAGSGAQSGPTSSGIGGISGTSSISGVADPAACAAGRVAAAGPAHLAAMHRA